MKTSIDIIIAETCERFVVTPADLCGPSRSRPTYLARMAAMYVIRTTGSQSYPEIGRLFGNSDHTSVMNAVRNVPELLGKDRAFQEKVVAIVGAVIAANYIATEAARGGVFKSVRPGRIRTVGQTDLQITH